ncbi:leucine-rich repeat domain-containing protein [Palleniella muris]|uniref:Leucine-rich repeat domain-containing protein n=1 Tax=Palleniella muris TaxID=3038145 RepID=A0AC61QLQ5_9BACT|nr:leucine-rich repeat domain-containing protein [Palleniella muris]
MTNIKNYAFNGCTALASVTLGNSVEMIGCCSFGGSKELTSITLHASLTGLNSDAFMYSSSLAEVNVDKENTYYCSVDGVVLNKEKTQLVLFPDGYNKAETYTIPNTVTELWGSTFISCKTITGIIIPSSVTQISPGALTSSSIKSITVDKDNPNYCSVDGVTYNKDKTTLEVCPGAYASSEYVILSSVTAIADNAFRRCSSLTSVTIPNSVKTIGMQAFTDCVGLASLEIPNSVETIGMSAFAGCGSLSSVTISNSIKTIDYETFAGCQNLTSITIPESVTTIGTGAFASCRGLVSLEIPNSVESIGDGAFTNCSGLTSVIIPNSVKMYSEGAPDLLML